MGKPETRRGQPAHAYKASLKLPKKADWRKLEKACVVAILTDQSHVILSLSHLTKLPEDFPHVITVSKVGRVDNYKVKARLVLRWMHEHGHTDITENSIKLAKKLFTLNIKEYSLDL